MPSDPSGKTSTLRDDAISYVARSMPTFSPFVCDPREVLALFDTVDRLRAEVESEREARQKLDRALRAKDEAMGTLFKRLTAIGVDCSDLIP